MLTLSTKGRPGFTIIEVIIALVILTIAAYAFTTLELTSKLWLRKAYYKTKAITVASTKMDENLAKSYTGLASSNGTKCVGTYWEDKSLSESVCLEKSGIPYTWSVTVTDLLMGRVPYKKIDVIVSYSEAGIQRTTTLSNIIAYPYIHVLSEDFEPTTGPISINYATIYTREFNFPVKKNIQISYSIAISVQNSAGILPLHTIYSRCLIVQGGVTKVAYPETRTPILTQPLISNWTQIDDVSPGAGTLILQWRKELPPDVVNFEAASVIMIAVEKL